MALKARALSRKHYLNALRAPTSPRKIRLPPKPCDLTGITVVEQAGGEKASHRFTKIRSDFNNRQIIEEQRKRQIELDERKRTYSKILAEKLHSPKRQERLERLFINAQRRENDSFRSAIKVHRMRAIPQAAVRTEQDQYESDALMIEAIRAKLDVID